jgi:hypothetical protein
MEVPLRKLLSELTPSKTSYRQRLYKATKLNWRPIGTFFIWVTTLAAFEGMISGVAQAGCNNPQATGSQPLGARSTEARSFTLTKDQASDAKTYIFAFGGSRGPFDLDLVVIKADDRNIVLCNTKDESKKNGKRIPEGNWTECTFNVAPEITGDHSTIEAAITVTNNGNTDATYTLVCVADPSGAGMSMKKSKK